MLINGQWRRLNSAWRGRGRCWARRIRGREVLWSKECQGIFEVSRRALARTVYLANPGIWGCLVFRIRTSKRSGSLKQGSCPQKRDAFYPPRWAQGLKRKSETSDVPNLEWLPRFRCSLFSTPLLLFLLGRVRGGELFV